MATNKTDPHHASLSGGDDSSVKRILTHIDRLLAFSKVEWFLHEQRKDTILKLDFIQDRKYTNVFQMSDSLPRVNDHISRLTQSHKLREWSLREREGCASIVIAFQYDNTQSDETLFFLNSDHLKLVTGLNEHTDSHTGSFSNTISVECQCKCNPGMSENKTRRNLPETYSTPLVSSGQPLSHCAADHGKVPSKSETDTLLLTPPDITPVKEPPTSVNQSDFRESQIPRRENKTLAKTPAPKAHQSTTASSTKRRAVKSESENTSKSFKNRLPSVIRKNAATKKPESTKNPFSVTGTSVNPNNANRKSKFIHTGNTRRPLQKSKSICVITRPSDTTPGKTRNTSATSQAENQRIASKFTFSKAYHKMKPESKPSAVNQSNPAVKRKHERSDHFTDTEDHISDPNSLKPRQRGMATNESTLSDKVDPKEVVLTNQNNTQNTLHGKGSYQGRPDNSSPVGDLYRLYFADSADISMYNNDVFWSSTDKTHNSKSSSQMADRLHCSTPSIRPPGGHAGVFGELAKTFSPSTTESTSDHKAANDFLKCQNNTSQTQSGTTSPRKSGTESLSETESNIDDSEQDTTITEASQTDCDMFSCCTEPCLEESVKEEIQEYFVKIYNQVQSEPRVETVQLVWQINEEGRICLYHKYLNQVKKHDLVSPEELQDLEKNGSHSVMPRSIRQQYIFRRLLDELDQVTFDNRPLTEAEKRRLDNFMTTEAGCV
ncbi:serine-rich adhesin for platelets-like [Haliotis asinina]|uniref:serine-rich adhesin for platelets-like n=1 Tax=Haliotis asinina TaxID=109174 RepID=UPI0035327DE2